MCYNAGSYERNIRTYKEEIKKRIDGIVKDFIKDIMDVGEKGYNNN